MGSISNFIETNFKHFNAASLRDAARQYSKHINEGKKMMVTLAGAMSTAELGISLAQMIREDKIHAICCTGANLEEDFFNLVAHNHYYRIPEYRSLTANDEEKLLNEKFNRVTDTCIPEETAIRVVERTFMDKLDNAKNNTKRYFPHEFFYQMIREKDLKEKYQIDEKHSWLVAAADKNIPLFVPGWEDSTLGNIFAAGIIQGRYDYTIVKSGVEYMVDLASWYTSNTSNEGIGFFQIGGGIAGDFPICVVPMIEQDLRRPVVKWSYFCQISDSTTSYGSYSGAVPNEKITWGKLEKSTPKFIIESDATIVAPLIFAYVLGQ